jgi:hypothetical protein
VFRPGKGLSVVIVNLVSLQIPVKVVLTGVSASQWWSVYIQYTKMEAFGQDLIFFTYWRFHGYHSQRGALAGVNCFCFGGGSHYLCCLISFILLDSLFNVIDCWA